MSTSSTLKLPCTYGKYELLERIGTGGMAEVYRAKLPGVAGFEKIVVIKRILPHLAKQQPIVDMFVEEAKIAARVQHRNVVQVFELGMAGEELYIAMEYIAGTDLSVLLRNSVRRKLNVPVWFTLHVVSEILSGLTCAHELTDDYGNRLNVVHRDVTPSNIFVSYLGDIKLGDFGVATTQQGSKERAGEIKGKIAYMAPEQLYAKPLDSRVDIFAAGVVLWECLTQRRLFGGRPELEMMNAICRGERVLPSRYNPAIPPELDRAVLAALEPDRDRRTATAVELQRQVVSVLPLFAAQILPSDVRHVVEVLLGQAEPGTSPNGPTRDSSWTQQAAGPAAGQFVESTPRGNRLKPYQMNPQRPSLPAPPPSKERVVAAPPAEPIRTGPLPVAEIDPEALRPSEPVITDDDVVITIEDTVDQLQIEEPHDVPFDTASLTPVVMVVGQPDGPRTADLPPWEDPRDAYKNRGPGYVRDGGYRGPHPFWLESSGQIWGPCDYGTIRRYLGPEASRTRPGQRIAAYQTAWAELDVFATLTGQEGLQRQQTLPPNRRLSGSLRTRGLISVLSTIWAQRSSGRLVIAGEDPQQPPRREIHFSEGVPIYVASDAASLPLPDILLRQGLIDDSDLPGLMHEVLYRLEPIEEAAARIAGVDLERQWPAVMRERAVELFYWRAGSYAFQEGFSGRRGRPFVRSALHLALFGVARAFAESELRQWLEPVWNKSLSPVERFSSKLRDVGLNEEQTLAARLLWEGTPISRLIERLPSEARTIVTVAHLLIEAGLLSART